MRRRRVMLRLVRWGGMALSLLIVLLYVASVPFYAGSTIGPAWSWRFEHGRIAVRHDRVVQNESFYIAANSEGLRFRPAWRLNSLSDWYVNVPLWLPLLVSAGGTAWAWAIHLRWARPEQGTACAACGYDLRGSADVCPECGREIPRFAS